MKNKDKKLQIFKPHRRQSDLEVKGAIAYDDLDRNISGLIRALVMFYTVLGYDALRCLYLLDGTQTSCKLKGESTETEFGVPKLDSSPPSF